ncbi:hypothetical protein [Pseudomonas brassicacearum]|nr:hypothetical protein [Pseudomonas brassicacearum]
MPIQPVRFACAAILQDEDPSISPVTPIRFACLFTQAQYHS